MKKIYICSPYRGDIEKNVANARRYCEEVLGAGHMPIAPHLYFTQFLDDEIPHEREKGLQMGLEWLAGCDEVLVCGDTVSEGMLGEIREAYRLGIKIDYSRVGWLMAIVEAIIDVIAKVVDKVASVISREE